MITFFRSKTTNMKQTVCACLLILAVATAFTTSRRPAGPRPTSSPEPTTAPKDWKLGIQLWTFHLVPFVVAIEKADSCHVKYLEAFPGETLGGDMKGAFGIHMSETDKAEVKQLLKSKGMQIVAMGVIRPNNMAEWKQYFDLAKEFGLSQLTAEPIKTQWDSIDVMAGSYGINVAIHDHPRPNVYWHPDSVLAAVKGHKHIGSCADVGHWARNGLDPVACLKELEGHIYGVHLKDIDSIGNTHAKDMIVGTGVIQFDPIFQELKRQNFKGLISIEHESNWYNNVPDVVQTIQFYNVEVAKL
jgi:sugar phosphate isomerase/epimerase